MFLLDIQTWNIDNNHGIIHSNAYPSFVRTNIEHTWKIYMNSFNEIEINLFDIDLDYEDDCLQIVTGKLKFY